MQIETISQILAALADPTRLRILHLLFRYQANPVDVTFIVESLNLPQPKISRHLAVLRDIQLVEVRKTGRQRRYSLPENQAALHAALLSALEPHVASTPQLKEDLKTENDLTEPDIQAKEHLHMENAIEGDVQRAQNDAIFFALSSESRRLILDVIERNPGCTAGYAVGFLKVSRQAGERHLDLLESAGLLHSQKEGRMRRLYYNAVPLQLIYDRWTDARSARMSTRMTAIKSTVEALQ